MDKLLSFFLKKYNSEDKELLLKAKFVLITTLIVIFSISLTLMYTSYLTGIESSIVIVELVGFLVMLFALGMLIQGNYNLAIHTLFISGFAMIWTILFIEPGMSIITKTDTIVFVIALLAAMPLLFSRNRKPMALYFIANMALFILFNFYLNSIAQLTVRERLDYFFDNSIVMIFVFFISLNLSSIYQQALISLKTELKDKKKAEKRYRTLFEKAVDAIFVIDQKSGKYLDANDAALQLTGRSWEALSQLTTQDVCPKDSDARLKKLHESQDTLELGEVAFIRPNGEKRTALLNSFPLDVNIVMGIARDITHELSIEKKLRQSQKMEAIGTLAGGIAHDFNNILSGVFGYSQLAQIHIENTKEVDKYLQRIIECGQRASKLIRQILTFSRQTHHEKQYLSLYIILKEAIKLLRSTLPATIEIKENIVSKDYIHADPTQMHQVIMNLCTNAYHAMSQTGGILTIHLKEINISHTRDTLNSGIPFGRYIELKISDTGQGMDEMTLEKAFEPYFTTKARGKGTGLGLSLVHAIVEEHEGYIKVESAVGKGTFFNLYFPIKTENDEKAYDSDPEENINLKGTGKILLVDDERDILFTTRKILNHSGYDVVVFENGIDAIDAFKAATDTFDIIITDMAMPKMNGIDLAEKILKIRDDIPIILCTGYNDSLSKKRANEIGIRRYVQKPVASRKLLTIIQEELQGKD